MGVTVVRRIREGSGLTLTEAARRVGVRPPTIAAYESGRFTPSDEKFWQIARALALGTPSKVEDRPTFLVTYWLLGQRFLSDAEGRVFVFRDPSRAVDQAERLDILSFPEVGVVPVWRSRRSELVTSAPVSEEAEGDAVDDPAQPLLAHVQMLAAEFERFAAGKTEALRPTP